MTLIYWCLDFVASFIEVLMCCIFCGTFLDKENLKEKKYPILWFTIIFSALVICMNNIELFSYITTFVFLVSIIIFQWLLYRKRSFLTIVLPLIYMVIFSAFDFCTAFGLAYLSNVNVNVIMNEQNILRLYGILFSKTILVLFIITINRFVNNNKLLPKRYVLIMFALSTAILSSNLIMVNLSSSNSSKAVNIFSAIYFISSLLIIILMFYFIIKIANSYEKIQSITLVEMKNEMLQRSLDETEQTFNLWRKSIHDYKNNIIALTEMANKNEINSIKDYLKQEIALINTKMFYVKTGNSTVDTIVNIKQNLANQLGINFIINAIVPQKCKISDIDLSNILGNMIDNAIEASRYETGPEITVNIKPKKEFYYN
jgi:signal transduction histidine kinase